MTHTTIMSFGLPSSESDKIKNLSVLFMQIIAVTCLAWHYEGHSKSNENRFITQSISQLCYSRYVSKALIS